MMHREPPDLFDLVDDDLDPGEEPRLRRAHDLLVAAGPPPELPPALEHAPAVGGGNVAVLPRRRRTALLGLAAALAAAAFGGGYLVGAGDGEPFDGERVVALHGTEFAPDAEGSIRLGPEDAAGNRPMIVELEGAPEVETAEGYYEVVLRRDGRDVGSCGSFTFRGDDVSVYLTAPYEVEPGDEWVVTAHLQRHLDNPPVALTT